VADLAVDAIASGVGEGLPPVRDLFNKPTFLTIHLASERGELASNRREEQELGMLCLHILQSCLGYINTLMIQDTLAEPYGMVGGGVTDRSRRRSRRSSASVEAVPSRIAVACLTIRSPADRAGQRRRPCSDCGAGNQPQRSRVHGPRVRGGRAKD
jgi:hypothetical protein